MTFAQICKQKVSGWPLQFTHPDLMGIMTFTSDGQLIYMVNDQPKQLPFWLSDFDRDDWHTV